MVKKCLCLVIPTLQAGGMERVMSELANYFCQKMNLDVHLILYGKNPELFYEISENLHVHKPLAGFNNNLRFFSTLGRLIYLRKTVKKINPESILSFGEFWNSFVLLALYGLSYPIYISDRCSPEKQYGKLHTFLRRWLYPRASGVVAQTEKAKLLYQGQFRHDNIGVIGNPIRQSGNNENSNENIVLTVGRLINSKNHDKLIEVFCKINMPGWKLIIVGGDALKQDNMTRLHGLIAELKAELKVTITGYVNNTEELYQRSKIFAFTSTSEGFPNVIGEAMSAALPVIAFDCVAGPSEMIQNEINGFLIPVNDYNTFSKRLLQLMSDEELRIQLGFNARISIKDFSIESIGKKYYDFILTA